MGEGRARQDNEQWRLLILQDLVERASLADLFRQIGHDERVHTHESLARMAERRFA